MKKRNDSRVWSEDRGKVAANANESYGWAQLNGIVGWVGSMGCRTSGWAMHRVYKHSLRLRETSKRNRAEFPEQRLDVTRQSTFAGEFKLSLISSASMSHEEARLFRYQWRE